MDFKEIVKGVGLCIDAAGVLVIVIGVGIASVVFLQRLKPLGGAVAYKQYRQQIGQAILLGLEFLVAGDIIRTVAVDPTMQNVAVLGVIVLIRTFLSIALEVELEGRWPWQPKGSG